jgi:hypothetical protein
MNEISYGKVQLARSGSSDALYTAAGTPAQRPAWMRDRALLPKAPPGRCPPEAPISDGVAAEASFVRTKAATIRPRPEARIRTEVVEPLVAELAKVAGVEPADVFGRTHRARVAKVRHEVWRRLSAAGHSLAAIGRMFDRDHATVLCALRGRGTP